ncbi:molybdopterin molybdotransferase MoeA [Halomonas sp. V046]|uniref:molybdopterin molybdotransferase MoeA n=1 Tax=Halomonas sp. V046 TaxID=3459611 RepID=UPI004044162A
MNARLEPSDCCPGKTGLEDLFAARDKVRSLARPLTASERTPLARARDRVLAEPIAARHAMPGVDNSAMDGYALRLADLNGLSGPQRHLAVTLRVAAGAGPEPLPAQGCARIFTGAPIPLGADAVVPQERVRLDEEGRVHFPEHITLGAHIRRQGEETRPGDALLAPGKVLDAVAIALLTAQGLTSVATRTRLRAAVISTGSELVPAGAPIAPGQVVNSNASMLTALLCQQGVDVVDLGIVEDGADAMRDALEYAARNTDLVICSGGVSVGEEDHVRPTLDALGGVSLHGVAMKPGKPFTLGYVGESPDSGTPVIGLPGNPTAALVAWHLLGLPFLHRRQGRAPAALKRFPVAADFARRPQASRRELIRVRLDWQGPDPVAELAGEQGSNMLKSACDADGYLMAEPGVGITPGQTYGYLPLSQFLA